MPSVASDSHSVLPTRPRLPNPTSQTESRDPATPFGDLLDSAAPQPKSPPRPREARSDRPERSDRADQPRPKDDRDTRATSANDKAKDTAKSGDEGPAATDANAAQNTQDAAPAATDGDGKTDAKATDAKTDDKTDAKTEKSADADGKLKPDVDVTAALNTLIVDPAPAVVAPQPVAVAVAVALPVDLAAPVAAATAAEASANADAGVEADALAALQAAGPAAGAQKPAKPQAAAQGDAHAKAATATGSTETQAALPQIESGKDGQSNANGEKAPGEFRHALASLLGKPDADAAPGRGDATAAVKAGADAVQNLNMPTPTQPANVAATAAAVTAPPQAQAHAAAAAAVPLTGLAVEIASQAASGKSHIEIRLDPAELGRINVHLDVDRDGNVNTRLVVDRADTLDLLKRDASSLERALQDAGLKTPNNGLEFSLRQHAFTQQDDKAALTAASAHIVVPDDDASPLEALRQGYGRLLGLGGGLDIRV